MFGLPGNPVSTLICLVRYVVPAIASIMASPRTPPQPIPLAAPAKFYRMLTYFVPVAVQHDARGEPSARPRPEPFPEGFVASLYRWSREG